MMIVRTSRNTLLPQFTPCPDKTATQTVTSLTTLLDTKEIVIVECETAAKTLSERVVVTLSVEGVNVRLSLLQQGLCLDSGTHISLLVLSCS